MGHLLNWGASPPLLSPAPETAAPRGCEEQKEDCFLADVREELLIPVEEKDRVGRNFRGHLVLVPLRRRK